jgi:hypothetical protein
MQNPIKTSYGVCRRVSHDVPMICPQYQSHFFVKYLTFILQIVVSIVIIGWGIYIIFTAGSSTLADKYIPYKKNQKLVYINSVLIWMKHQLELEKMVNMSDPSHLQMLNRTRLIQDYYWDEWNRKPKKHLATALFCTLLTSFITSFVITTLALQNVCGFVFEFIRNKSNVMALPELSAHFLSRALGHGLIWMLINCVWPTTISTDVVIGIIMGVIQCQAFFRQLFLRSRPVPTPSTPPTSASS